MGGIERSSFALAAQALDKSNFVLILAPSGVSVFVCVWSLSALESDRQSLKVIRLVTFGSNRMSKIVSRQS